MGPDPLVQGGSPQEESPREEPPFSHARICHHGGGARPGVSQEAEHRPRSSLALLQWLDLQGAGCGHAGPGPECDPDPEAET